jgi:hypothetical protein
MLPLHTSRLLYPRAFPIHTKKKKKKKNTNVWKKEKSTVCLHAYAPTFLNLRFYSSRNRYRTIFTKTVATRKIKNRTAEMIHCSYGFKNFLDRHRRWRSKPYPTVFIPQPRQCCVVLVFIINCLNRDKNLFMFEQKLLK